MSKNDKKYTYKTLVMSNDINREGTGVGFQKDQRSKTKDQSELRRIPSWEGLGVGFCFRNI